MIQSRVIRFGASKLALRRFEQAERTVNEWAVNLYQTPHGSRKLKPAEIRNNGLRPNPDKQGRIYYIFAAQKKLPDTCVSGNKKEPNQS